MSSRSDSLVATKLAKPGERNVEHEPVSGGPRLHEYTEVKEASFVSTVLWFDVADHLCHLQVDKRMILFSVHVILDDDGSCFFVAVLSNKPKM